jgi:hypothetical protein
MTGFNAKELTPPSPDAEYARFSVACKLAAGLYPNFACSTDHGGGKRRAGIHETKGPKTKSHASDDDCTNEGPNKYFEPSAAFNQVAKKLASNGAEHSADYSRDL